MGEGKRKRVLTIDIGNSNIVIGLFEGDRFKWHRRFLTGKTIPLLKKIWFRKAEGVVVASVVPKVDQPLKKLIQKKFGIDPIFVSSKIPLPIRLKVKKPAQVGADRVANAVGVYFSDLTPHPPLLTKERGRRGGEVSNGVIIIDFGTATTFDVISEKGEYLGGPIIPGLGICAAALYEKTAKLPLVRIKKPRRVIGKETGECIQSGLYYGYAGMVDRLIEKIQREYGKKMMVMATGGLASLISKECHSIRIADPFLTLKGLRLIYEYHAQRTF